MSNEEIIGPREYPLPGSTPWINKLAREDSERAIGRICMAFQELEELVSCLIGLLISDDNQLGLIITSELSFRNKLGLLYSLYLYRTATPERPEALKKLLARLRRVEESRNTILHSYWVKSLACGMLTRYKTTAKSAKGFVQDVEDLQPEHIEAIAAEIGVVADDLILYFDKAFPTTTTDKISQALQTSREGAYKHAPPLDAANRRFKFAKSRQLFIRVQNETVSVVPSKKENFSEKFSC